MEVIRDRNGIVIQRSRNLRGIRRYVGGTDSQAIAKLAIDRVGSGEGRLAILFIDGTNFETTFADFTLLKRWVARWRGVRGAPLTVNGVRFGNVVRDHLALK